MRPNLHCALIALAATLACPAVGQGAASPDSKAPGSFIMLRLGGLEEALSHGGAASIEGTRARAVASSILSSLKVSSIASNRVNLEFRETPLEDAIRRVLACGAMPFRIENDLPEGVKVTLSLPNVRVGTALDMLTQAGRVGWRMELQGGKLQIRVARSVPPMDSLGAMLAMCEDLPLQAAPIDLTAPRSRASNPISFHTTVREHRALFRCPHCSATARILAESDGGKCAAAGHPMAAESRVCPRDGSSWRPNVPSWRFCPLCGKRIQGPDRTAARTGETASASAASRTRGRLALADTRLGAAVAASRSDRGRQERLAASKHR